MSCTKEGAVVDRREMLRVKAKSLAEEARIIRKEETRAGRSLMLQEELRRHRRQNVRLAARETYVAYGLIKGKALDAIERPKQPRSPEMWKRVKSMVEKYGPIDAGKREEILSACQG